jgi:hypothetical protein
VRDLPRGVDPSVGTARAHYRDAVAPEKDGECSFELALHRWLIALFLPAMERSTVIGDLEFHSTGHRGHPRIDRSLRESVDGENRSQVRGEPGIGRGVPHPEDNFARYEVAAHRVLWTDPARHSVHKSCGDL